MAEHWSIWRLWSEHRVETVSYTHLDVYKRQVYGHRNNRKGYAEAATTFDRQLGTFMERMRDDDILMITADHGCDPGFPGTDHTREHTPFLVYGKSIREDVNLGTRESFADIAATILDIFNVENNTDGTSMKEYILKK